MKKIPKFPEFKNLELSDKEEVEKYTRNFPPYSDFNFANLWSWDIHGRMMISQLNKNLVVLFNDYVTADEFLSFIGNNKIPQTTTELITFSKKNFQKDFLIYVPEENAVVLSDSGFKTKPDRDSYDYIYSVEQLSCMDKWHKNSKSKKIKKFILQYPEYKVTNSSICKTDLEEHKEMFKKWADNKQIENHFELNEYKAFERILQVKDHNIQVLSLYYDENLVGFTIYEILSPDYAIAHFSKTDITFPSGYEVLIWEEAKLLKAKGIKYYNWELDLGLSGLRYFKEKYHPAFFLKKFTVSFD